MRIRMCCKPRFNCAPTPLCIINTRFRTKFLAGIGAPRAAGKDPWCPICVECSKDLAFFF